MRAPEVHLSVPSRFYLLTVVLVVACLQPACEQFEVTDFYHHGVVASVSPIASDYGRDVLARGGNAFDAAVGTALALAVVYPQAGNLGGGGFAVIRDGKSGQVLSLDFRETAPLSASENMFLDESGGVREGASTNGALSAGVPGSVAGLYELWKAYGSLPWESLVNPIAHLADSGFVVDSFLAADFKSHATELDGLPDTRKLYAPDGSYPKAGDRLVLKDLGQTLFEIGRDGPLAFYSGTIAEAIVGTCAEHGGLITNADLETYRPIWRQPVSFTFDSLTVFSMGPPSSGGVIVGQILKLLEPYDLGRFTSGSPEYIHLFCEAARLAFADRSVHLGDPDFYNVPSTLLDSTYLGRRRLNMSATKAGVSSEIGAGSPPVHESDQTTHISVCDSAGNIVSLTTTINSSFGSKLVVAGAGFLLNNEMDDFSIKPGYPNQYGLVGSEANKIEPGKRMLSSMSPTVITVKGRPFLVLGSPGGSKIITTVASAIINFSRFGLSAGETVAAPRFHHQWLPDEIVLEEGGFSSSVVKRLEAMGHTVVTRKPFCDLQLIYISPLGLMTGASDPRNGGRAVGY